MKPTLCLAILLAFISCKKKDKENSKEPQPVNNCVVAHIDMSVKYGHDKSYTFEYDNEWRLIRQLSFDEGDLEYVDVYHYDGNGQIATVLTSSDSTGANADTAITFHFEQGRLVSTKKYDAGSSIYTSEIYNYDAKGHLLKLTRKNQYYEKEFAVLTDVNGNIIRLTLVRENGSDPESKEITEFSYDDKINPFFHQPIGIGHVYFSPNNMLFSISRINDHDAGRSEVTYTYLNNNLIDKKFDRENVQTYTYHCN